MPVLPSQPAYAGFWFATHHKMAEQGLPNTGRHVALDSTTPGAPAA